MRSAPVISITGLGCVTCAGDSPSSLWENARAGRSGIREGLGYVDIGGKRKAELLALSAIDQAMRQAGWEELREDDLFFLGTTTGRVSDWEPPLMAFLAETASAESVLDTFAGEPLGRTLEALQGKLGFHGRTQLVTTACTASTHAIALAARWLRSGRARRCLVGGVEVLSRLTVDGFRSLQLLSTIGAAPFDAARTGINLAEGAAFLCLEVGKTEKSLARITGGGLASDAHHMTAPEPEGRGSREALTAALREAALPAAEVSWIHAHGTGSLANDQAEGQAFSALFGAEVPVTSTKGIHGHALAASGAIETVLCVEALRRGERLATHNLVTPDPKIAVRHATAGAAPLRHVVKNTLGFGGSNGALVLSRVEESR